MHTYGVVNDEMNHGKLFFLISTYNQTPPSLCINKKIKLNKSLILTHKITL